MLVDKIVGYLTWAISIAIVNPGAVGVILIIIIAYSMN